ncbi:MAG: hypothetical protein PVF08_10735 [Gammaproteobacteria bacterium]|jgi:hypothetical protein
MRIIDMVMHVDESLTDTGRRHVERIITGQRGVLHAHFNEQRPHLMLVAYDTDRVSSFEILANIMGHHLGAERVA